MKKIEVLGPGCPNCKKTADIIRKVIEDRGWIEGEQFELVKVTDLNAIAAKGILATPGVVVDGVVVSRGKIPKKKIIESWLDK